MKIPNAALLATVLFLATACGAGSTSTGGSGGTGGDAGSTGGGSGGSGGGSGGGAAAEAPEIGSTFPASNAIGVALNARVAVTFTAAMDPATITATTFAVKQGTTAVAGTVTTAGMTATFVPAAAMTATTAYTVTITPGVKSLAGQALAASHTWTFSTGTTAALGPAPVGLGTAGNYVVLAKTAISTVPSSAVTGDVGLSPAALSFLTGFSLVADATNVFSTSPQVTGKLSAANSAVPTPVRLTTAISNMEAAYADAASRPTPDFLELGTGNLGGRTLAPGLYQWTSSVTVPSQVTLAGGANDVWIFQTSGDLSVAVAQNVVLSGGARAANVFWQVAGQVTVGAGAHFEGIVMSKTQITLQTGATMNGRLLAQTQVALQQATVTQP